MKRYKTSKHTRELQRKWYQKNKDRLKMARVLGLPLSQVPKGEANVL